MLLVSEDEAANDDNEYLFQEEVGEDGGIITVCQKVMTGISSKQMATFGYDIENFLESMTEGKTALQLVSEDGGVVTHHQRMLTPSELSNRSMFPTTYHMHDDSLEGQYTLIRSSEGN